VDTVKSCIKAMAYGSLDEQLHSHMPVKLRNVFSLLQLR
jgi:hypothetical protein